MGKGKIIQLEQSEQAQAKAYRETLREHHRKGLLQSIEAIDRALQNAAEDKQALAFLFQHLSMMINNGTLKDLLAQEQKGAQ